MKILVVSNFFPPHFVGGAEIIALQQAQALAARGHEVRVFAGDSSREEAGYPVRDESYEGLLVRRVSLTRADFQPGGNDLAHLAVDARFSRQLDEWQPDVVHAHHLLGLSLGIIGIAHRRKIPVYMTMHDHWGFCLNSTRITRAGRLCNDTTRCAVDCRESIKNGEDQLPVSLRQDYIRWQLQAVDGFIFPSHYLAQAYQAVGLPASRIHVIANGIAVERFASHPGAGKPVGAGGGRLRLLFIGYMGPHKGVPQLLEALATLPGERIQLDFVGDGHALAEYRQYLATHAPQVSARFWGRLPNAEVVNRLAESDLLVLPSVCPENQPVSITEAMARGLPVIASDIGGIPELVQHQVTGLLARAGSVDDLAAAIRHYLEQPADLARHGAAAFARIQALALSVQAEKLEALFARPIAPAAQGLAFACYGQPVLPVWQEVRQLGGGSQSWTLGANERPAWVPANWIDPASADLLWVAGARQTQHALDVVDAYGIEQKPVLVDERNVRLLRRLGEGVLICRGRKEHGLALRFLNACFDACNTPGKGSEAAAS